MTARRIARIAVVLLLASGPVLAWPRGKAPEPRAGGLFDIFKKKADTSGGDEKGTYSVLLFVCRSPAGHIQQAKYYKQATEKHAGWDHMFIIHKQDHSLLYWGKYSTVEAASDNLKKAKEYVTPAGVKVFAKAIVVPLPGAKDPGPDEWNLDRVPEKYRYTVLRAAFYDVPEADYVGRKQFAVDYCRQLREDGVEAYFKHDSAQSIVTIGLFGPEAVELIRKGPKVERKVRDPRIKAVFKRFPELAINGRQKLVQVIDTKTRKARMIPASTYLMVIPRSKDDGKSQDGSAVGSVPGTVACELHVMSVADGKVLATAGARAKAANLEGLVRVLVAELSQAKGLDKDKPIAVVGLRPHEAEEGTIATCREAAAKATLCLRQQGWKRVKDMIDLSDELGTGRGGFAKVVTGAANEGRLDGVTYVLTGTALFRASRK